MKTLPLLVETAAQLRAAGVDSPEWDAERLIRHVLGWDRATFVARPEVELPPEAEARIRTLVARRAAREPLQYILGIQAFWKHEFLVTPDVLIPRPETELLVETSLALLREVGRPLIVDVGTGSGCIALSLAFERPDAEVHATDISEPALTVARENARRLGLERRVAFHRGDLLEPVAHLAGRVDLIVSNPPYVGPAEEDSLAPEVRHYEPPIALFTRAEAPSAYEGLLARARRTLRPRGRVVLELGAAQSAAVTQLAATGGLRIEREVRDLQGLARVVVMEPTLGAPGT